jgi:hypothetical protein
MQRALAFPRDGMPRVVLVALVAAVLTFGWPAPLGQGEPVTWPDMVDPDLVGRGTAIRVATPAPWSCWSPGMARLPGIAEPRCP